MAKVADRRPKTAVAAEAEEKITRSSGNVFADLDLPNPEEELAKAKLVSALGKAIKSRKLTQAKVAEIVGVDQPAISKLLRGRTTGFSIDRLLGMLTALDQDVEIRVRPRPAEEKREAKVLVEAFFA